jgi:hypothetical protein
MALTITNHLIRSADAPHTAGLGGGGGTVTWLPSRVLTERPAAVIRTAAVASQILADCNPEVYDDGFWSRADAWAGRLGLTGPAGIMHASEVPGGRVVAWPAAGCGVVAAGDLRGEEDEQA